MKSRAQAGRSHGFTLAELLFVGAVLALLGLLLAPHLSVSSPQRLDVAAEEVANALRFARREAMRTGNPHAVEVQHGTGRVVVFQANLTGGSVGVSTTVRNPVDKKPYDFKVHEIPNARGVTLLNEVAVFGFEALATAKNRVVFDATGMPFTLVSGNRRKLAGCTIRLGLEGHERQVVLSPVGRVTVS